MKPPFKIVFAAIAAVVCLQLAWTYQGLAADPESPTPPTEQPEAPVLNVQDTFFGVQVDDPYRYMENLSDPVVQAWLKAQADYTRTILDDIPGRQKLLDRIVTIDAALSPRIWDVNRLPGDQLFYLKRLPQDNVFKLYVRNGLNGDEKLLVDPETYAKATGKPHAINYFEPSWDGKYLAYGISAAGSEEAVIHVMDAATGAEVDKPIDRAQFGEVNWRGDGKSFFYIRLQKLGEGMDPTERYLKSKVFLHVMGDDPEKDTPVYGYGVSDLVKMEPSDIPIVFTDPASDYALGVIAHGTQNEITLYVAPVATLGTSGTPWKKACDVGDAVTGVASGGDNLYLLTHNDAPRFKLIKTSVSNPEISKADVVVPQSSAVLAALAAAKDALYVQARDGVFGKLIRVPYDGTPEAVALPFDGTVSLAAAEPRCDGVFLTMASWTKAPQVYSYDPATKQLANTGLQPAATFDLPDSLQSVVAMATSYDGTMIPLSVVYRQGIKMDGSNPTLLSGYGAYGIPQEPWYVPRMLAFLERGGILATAHVRGGGEYGEEWYRAGYKGTKPNTWKDFIACAQYLIDNKYTSPGKLACTGGSAGGILVGRAITERPDLFGIAIPQVGALDMLRAETTPNGIPNIPEFGTVKTEEGFKALFEMSAYHHVKNGVKYPAVLLTAGMNDPRVEPWETAKMAARLQAATASGRPVLLRLDYEAGHGIGTTKRQVEEETADIWTFVLWQAGVPDFQPSPGN
jgi:prolyl oligopeptidase